MTEPDGPSPPLGTTHVPRRRYERERRARLEAEHLLEAKSRELYEANQALRRQAASLEDAIQQRTSDLEAARTEAEAASAAKSIFLATMSHEIRTPLNGVLGMAQALNDTRLTNAQKEMLDIVLQSGHLLQTVLNDILDLSKIEAGKYDIEEIVFDLRDAVRSVEAMFGLKAQEKGLDFKVDFAPDAAGFIKGDPNRLRQILGNLISNAIKFTSKGLVHVLISVHPAGENHELHLVVKDTGKGISHEVKSRLFTPYTQAGPSISGEFGGTGLGLSIARRLCELMHGELSVESEEGKGAQFTARVRVTPTQAPQSAPVQNSEEELKRFLRKRPCRIIVAEDNRTNQLVLQNMLRGFDLMLETVSNGQELLASWQSIRPDLILMDIQMPVMNGREATVAIRDTERKEMIRRTPIIALSANIMRQQEIEYRQIGMDGCVPKPFRKEQLLSAILGSLKREMDAGMV